MNISYLKMLSENRSFTISATIISKKYIIQWFNFLLITIQIIWMQSLMLAKNIRFNISSGHRFQRYSIRPLTLEHKTQALKFMQQQFFHSQLTELAYYKQYPEQKSKSYLYWDRVQRLFATEIFQGGLSFGCYDQENGQKFIGAILAKNNSFIPANDPYPEPGSFLYAIRRLKEVLFAQVLPEYYQLINAESAPTVDMWLSAIDPKHRGQGLQKKLMNAVEQAGASQSYQYIISWATSRASAASHKKLGFTKVAEIDVREFEDRGERYFKELELEERYQSLWVKEMAKNASFSLQQ